jgi:hypothetical protein
MIHHHLMLMYRIGGVLPLVPIHIFDIHLDQSDKLLLALTNTVILSSKSCRTCDHILLSHNSGSRENLVHQGLNGHLCIASVQTDFYIHMSCHRNMF